MPHYTQDELILPGVKFESVNIDKLETYFDNCDTFINNALSVESFKEGMKLRVKTRRYCLNYKPFTYHFNINSDKETKAMLKIFLGPALDDMKEKDLSYLHEYYKYFIEMDKFNVTCKSRYNLMTSSSSFFLFFAINARSFSETRHEHHRAPQLRLDPHYARLDVQRHVLQEVGRGYEWQRTIHLPREVLYSARASNSAQGQA